jgi:putative transposase
MRLMRLVPIYQEPNTSKKHPAHKIYPYLLKGLAITRPNQVWCADITYIRMERGFLYLVAIMDRHSRRVFDGLTRPHRGHGPISPWRLSNTLEADFCVAALKEALAEYGPPEIFNTDQGAQFTSGDWTCELKAAKVQISMDGKGRWIDNRMIERLWRSLNRRSAKRNTNASTCAPSRPGHRPETVSANGWPITTPRGPTRPTAS